MGAVWYAMRVQNGREDKVIQNLRERIKAAGLEDRVPQILTPTEKVGEIRSGEKKVRERKLYAGYVFLQMDLTGERGDEVWYLLRDTAGLGMFVGPGPKPVPMDPKEVEKMLGEVDRGKAEPAKVKIDFKAGDSVKIREGPFENIDGQVEEVFPATGRVRVMVTIFGRATPVELEYWQVEAV